MRLLPPSPPCTIQPVRERGSLSWDALALGRQSQCGGSGCLASGGARAGGRQGLAVEILGILVRANGSQVLGCKTGTVAWEPAVIPVVSSAMKPGEQQG